MVMIVEHTEHPAQLFPTIYRCDLTCGSTVNAVKKDLLIQEFAARGWTSREMKLTMKGTELDDDYKFMEGARLTLELIVYLSSAEDSTENKNNPTISPDKPVVFEEGDATPEPEPASCGVGDGG
ncbi:MAG: hypothetical protein ACKPKO_07845, partial [Candidatus Fonsibacter sp.]